MKATHWIIAAAALAFVPPAPADAATTDPEVIIYRFPGVFDDGRNATSFHCTNFSGATETIRFVTRASTSALLSNVAVNIAHLATFSTSTHDVAIYADAFPALNTGAVVQGTTAIAATSINIVCTAMTVEASALVLNGVALRGIRFSPVPGSQE
jgi:hypothetical protein